MRKNMKALMPNLPGIEFWPDLDTPDDVETANLELSCTVEAVHARAEILTPTMAEILQFQPTTHRGLDGGSWPHLCLTTPMPFDVTEGSYAAPEDRSRRWPC